MVVSSGDLGNFVVREVRDLMTGIVGFVPGSSSKSETGNSKFTFRGVVIGCSSREYTAGRGENENVVSP